MTTPSYLLPLFFVLLGLLLVLGIGGLAAQDATQRGFSRLQAFLIGIVCIIFFPVSLIAYLIFRPPVRV
jgi:hypothetical protein